MGRRDNDQVSYKNVGRESILDSRPLDFWVCKLLEAQKRGTPRRVIKLVLIGVAGELNR